jgi:glycosyltransferase involved in cell wall biosynthesis
MPRKKILISARCLEVGGIERSLLGLLNTFDYTQYEVDLFLWSHSGPFMGMIPQSVNLLPEIKAYALMDKPIAVMLHRGFWALGFIRLSLKLYLQIRALLGDKVQDTLAWYYHEYSLPFLPAISQIEYDLAISFQGPTTFLDKVQAKRKIGWVHTDYSYLKIDVNFMAKVWQRADAIATVSESCRAVFADIFPGLADRLIVVENILSPEFVRQHARVDVSSEMPIEPGVVRLCTVGRYSYPKAFDQAVLICKRLVEMGVALRWYAIGPDRNEPALKQQIHATGMEKYFILVGEKVNPYPYMSACDLYVQPSRYEGKAVTVREAQMLGKPVVITNFATAASQLQDGYDGVIVPLDVDACARALKSILEDQVLREKLSQNALNTDYGNKDAIQIINQLIP